MTPCLRCAWCVFNLALHGRAFLSLCTMPRDERMILTGEAPRDA